MDTWKVKCESCGAEYEVKASTEKEAILLAEQQHEKVNEETSMFRCDFGPFMNVAFNLTHPRHPGAPKDF